MDSLMTKDKMENFCAWKNGKPTSSDPAKLPQVHQRPFRQPLIRGKMETGAQDD